MGAPSDLKVFIRNWVGQYLCRDGKQWGFTTDSTKAHFFDGKADKVAEQLELARHESGAISAAVQVEAQDAAESCDKCGRKLRSTEIQFDGTRYLCPNCRSPKVAGSLIFQ